MIDLGLQYFGGRGGSGSRNTGNSSSATKLKQVESDSKIKEVLTATDSFWKNGATYQDEDGETVKIGYELEEDYTIRQTSDGLVYSDARVQRMVEGQDAGKYHAWNENGELIVTKSAKVAAKHAWGTPKQFGYKKSKK